MQRKSNPINVYGNHTEDMALCKLLSNVQNSLKLLESTNKKNIPNIKITVQYAIRCMFSEKSPQVHSYTFL